MKKPSALVLLIALLLSALALHRVSNADPGFSWLWTSSSNQMSLTVTNHTAGAAYNVLFTPVVGDPLYDWSILMVGATNQSNFVITNFIVEPNGFFQIVQGLNWDGDGFNNEFDAQPGNSAVGALAITIDFPTQGLTLQ